MAYWYNVDSGEVETEDTRSPAANVLGPYETEAEAREALERVRANNERFDEEDREFEDYGSGGE